MASRQGPQLGDTLVARLLHCAATRARLTGPSSLMLRLGRQARPSAREGRSSHKVENLGEVNGVVKKYSAIR